MQIVDRPLLCISRQCLDRTSLYTPSLPRLCFARHVAAPCCRNIVREGRKRRCAEVSCSTATRVADRKVSHQLHSSGGAALRLVQTLAEDLNCMKQIPLSPACSLTIYRLTRLCTAHHQYEVLSVLAQDSELHNGSGVYLHMVQLLQQNEDAASQGLAADLIQAMLSSYSNLAASGMMSASPKVLNVPHVPPAFDCTRLLEVITSSSNLKVKTSAVLVLLLITAGGSGGHSQVTESGAAVITLLEMLCVAGSWPATSAHQQSAQPSDSGGMHALSEAEPAQTAPREITAALPFMEACSPLLHRLFRGQAPGDLRQVAKLLQSTFALGFATNLAFSVSTCNWKPVQPVPATANNPLARVLQWWRQRFPMLTLAGCSFRLWGISAPVNILIQPQVSAIRMLRLADNIRKQRQAAKHLIEGSHEAFGLEIVIKDVTAILLGAIDTKSSGVGQQLGRDAFVRSMTPSLLALLQHPAEARRAFAAEYASLLGTQASGVVVSALLSSDSCLSTLLKRLSGDDKPASRSHYARLIACCAEHQACDAAVLKKISDSGAVPYLLRLLKEIEGSDQKFRVVYCLERLAQTSHELMSSIVVHGGTQQLLNLVQAGVRRGSNGQLQLDEESDFATQYSIQALFYMLREPAAEAHIIKADLAGLVLELMQGPSLQSVAGLSTVVLNSLYGFSCQPAGRQQLLDKLTTDSSRIMVDLSLKYLEAPNPCHASLVVAADLLQLAGELPAGRQQLAVPAVGSRMLAVLTAPCYRKAQGYILPTLGLLAYLKPDGTYNPNPWLDEPTATSVPSPAADNSPSEAQEHARQNLKLSAYDSQLSSESDPQQLLATASARLSQRSTAELPHATPSHGSHGAASAGTAASQQAQGSTSSLEELQPDWGQGFQEALVQSAAALVSKSPLPGSRFQAMSWLTLLVPQLTDQGCTEVASSEAVQASVRMIQRESEPARTRAAAVEFCLTLHGRGALPVTALLEAGVHQHLTSIVAQSDDRAGLLAPAGALLSALWQAQPPLVSEFVSQRNLPALLKWAAQVGSSSAQHCLVALTLLHQVWSFTASLVSEPLLVQAIPAIVQCCGRIQPADGTQPTADALQLQAEIQEEAVALLCSMAAFPFYRPAIRKAEPAGALTSMLQAGCSPDDGQQLRTIAQLALNLVHKLLKGQMDESNGLNAPYNYSFLGAVTVHPKAAQSITQSESVFKVIHSDAAYSIMRMSKQGSLESRHAALAVLQQILVNRHGRESMDTLQQELISLGLMPLLFGIAQAPDSTAEMRAMADACLASVHSEQNGCMASFGTHCLLARLITITLNEQQSGR